MVGRGLMKILNTAKNKIFINHNKQPLSDECVNCGYLYLCKTGCPFVKNTYNIAYAAR